MANRFLRNQSRSCVRVVGTNCAQLETDSVRAVPVSDPDCSWAGPQTVRSVSGLGTSSLLFVDLVVLWVSSSHELQRVLGRSAHERWLEIF